MKILRALAILACTSAAGAAVPAFAADTGKAVETATVAAPGQAPAASSTSWPTAPIRMIVAWPAGGGTDSAARVVARYLSDRLHQSVIVENRGGASGMVGTEYVARAKPDGYTIQYTVADSHSIDPHVFTDARYNALKDFTPVAMVGSMPNALVVNPKIPASTVAEFVTYAKAHPGKLTYSSWGVGSGGHIRMEAFDRQTGVKMLHVPYQGSGPALAAVLSGTVDAMMVPLGLAESNVEAGKLRALGIDTPWRVEESKDIPTFTEQGVPLVLTFWQGILVPAGTPQPIVDKLNKAAVSIIEDPQAKADLLKIGVVVGTAGVTSLPDTRKYFDAEYKRWGDLIKEAGITAQ
jgi:tripartite-type tricarboxylate transporter receptor subunit TctC